MFNKKDRFSIVKEQRKILPYSIREIGGPLELQAWKANQAIEQQRYEAYKALKRASVIKGMTDGSLVEKHSQKTQSEITKAYERYSKPTVKPKLSVVKPIKYSIFKRIYIRILNYFLNLKF